MDTWEGNSKNNITLNKYLYCHGNPVSELDPSGNITMTELMGTLRIMAKNIAKRLSNHKSM